MLIRKERVADRAFAVHAPGLQNLLSFLVPEASNLVTFQARCLCRVLQRAEHVPSRDGGAERSLCRWLAGCMFLLLLLNYIVSGTEITAGVSSYSNRSGLA